MTADKVKLIGKLWFIGGSRAGHYAAVMAGGRLMYKLGRTKLGSLLLKIQPEKTMKAY